MQVEEEKIKAIIDNLQSKVDTLKPMQLKEGDRAKERELNGMIEGFEYSITELNKILPTPPPIAVVLTAVGAVLFALGVYIALYFYCLT